MPVEIQQDLTNAKDLISKMIQYNPDSRITANEILESPFFTTNPVNYHSLSPLKFPESDVSKQNLPNIPIPLLRILPPPITA